jgi:hypothetical protein
VAAAVFGPTESSGVSRSASVLYARRRTRTTVQAVRSEPATRLTAGKALIRQFAGIEPVPLVTSERPPYRLSYQECVCVCVCVCAVTLTACVCMQYVNLCTFTRMMSVFLGMCVSVSFIAVFMLVMLLHLCAASVRSRGPVPVCGSVFICMCVCTRVLSSVHVILARYAS